MKVWRNVLVVIFTAAAFFVGFKLNHFLFQSLEFSKGASWIFLPSGLRLVFVLVFAEFGAVGIVLGSLCIGLQSYYIDDPVNAVIAGLLSGVCPLIARRACTYFLRVRPDLETLTPVALLQMAAVFAVISGLLHQAWYSLHGQTDQFVSSAGVMALGDFTGTLVVLYVAKYALVAMHSSRSRAGL
jgi:hypothetical protein